MNHIDLSPIVPIFNEFLITVVTGLILIASMWVRALIRKYAGFLGQQNEQLLVGAFQRGLQNGVNIYLHKLEDFEKENSQVPIPGGFKGWVAAKAGQYAIDHSPDYVAQFMGDKSADEAVQDAAQKALAFIPRPDGQEGLTGASVPVTPVEAKPLP